MHMTFSKSYPEQMRPPFNQAAYFEPQKVRLGAVRGDSSVDKGRQADSEFKSQSKASVHDEDSTSVRTSTESNANMVLIHLHEMHFNVLHQGE